MHPDSLNNGGEAKKRHQTLPFHAEQTSDNPYPHTSTSHAYHMTRPWVPQLSTNNNTHNHALFEAEAMFFLSAIDMQDHSDQFYLLSNAHTCDAYGNTILHQLVIQYLYNKSASHTLDLIACYLKSKSAPQLLCAKNMRGKTALHYAADNRCHALALLLLARGGRAARKAVTPEGETYDSLIGTAHTTPLLTDIREHDPQSTPLMQATYQVDESNRQSMIQFYQALEESANPAYITDAYNSALSLCRSPLAKHAIRAKILAMRRVHIRYFLNRVLHLPLDIVEELLQYANIT